MFNLANIRSEQMRYDEARALYENVIKRAPGQLAHAAGDQPVAGVVVQ